MLLLVRRVFLFLSFIALGVTAGADWLVFIPSGRKIQLGSAKTEFTWAATTSRDFRTITGYGVTKEVELDLTSETLGSRNTLMSFDMSYNFLDPVVNYVPGLQVGVIDAPNVTADGRRFYIATSYDIGMTGAYNGDSPMMLTVGAVTGGLNGPFVGVAIPFTHSFVGIAEHDSRNLTAGFEFRPTRATSLKWLFTGNRVVWSAGFSTRL